MVKRFVIFILLLLLLFGVSYFWWNNAISPVDSKDNTKLSFTIGKGESIKEISAHLKEAGLIRNKVAFFTYLRFSGLANKIQAGNYQLSKSSNAFEIANSLIHGTTDIWVTIIEGWRIEETLSYLSKTLKIPLEELENFSQEGYLFPDTYLIPQKAQAQEVVQIILDNFQKHLNQEIIEKGLQQGLTKSEIITLASIIEREVKTDEDRSIVAGIFLKRLSNNWPLQADATIQYALGYQENEQTWWKKALTPDDLKIDSPYNTYLYVGLPPRPICSPGMQSIEAVVNPKETDYWFYLSDKKGITHFAKTQEEQQRNIEKYLQ